MHVSSFDSMRWCLQRHVLPDPVLRERRPLRVLDVGGADVNGSYQRLFAGLDADYVVLDPDPGSEVDLRPDASGRFPIEDESFDIVLSGQTFEHAPRFWETFDEMVRVCAHDGVLVVIVPSAGPEHRYPVDCYRFLPDSMGALAEMVSVHLVDTWTSPFGPFHDLVGVFRREIPSPGVSAREPVLDLLEPLQNEVEMTGPLEIERGEGAEHYASLLARVHEQLEPRFYLEVGVEYGTSLRAARCPAVGLDPSPQLGEEPLGPDQRVVLMTSDDFFTYADVGSELGALDLAYIDGMHRIENVVKDFLHVERHAHAASVVLIDDVFPVHPLQAQRERETAFWTGDVWKIMPLLRGARPDLLLLPIDTWPSGMLLVTCLDPGNVELQRNFDLLMAMAIEWMTEVHDDVLQRTGALHPADPLIGRVLRLLRAARDQDDPSGPIESVRSLVAGALPRRVVVPS